MTDPLPTAIPAATLVIFRERDAGDPEVLMVERAAAMTFAAGALVFPGGRVDPADRTLAATLGGDGDETAARLAAIRETVEEVGLAIGLTPAPDAAALARLRAALLGGAALAEACAAVGIAPDPAALMAFARWRPAHRDVRIYDTRFYLARLPADAPAASVDATENVRLLWVTASNALTMVDAGEAAVIFPTRRTLERLARFASFDTAVADARAHPIEVVTPWIEDRDGGPHLCIPEGLGYPITAERLTSVRRG